MLEVTVTCELGYHAITGSEAGNSTDLQNNVVDFIAKCIQTDTLSGLKMCESRFFCNPF